MWKFWSHQTWTNKKIAFVAMLIATSVVFVLIFTKIMPIASIPSFKLMAGGLPVKLTGYIFGPLIGAITGIVADLVSFAMAPMFIHYWYTLAFMLTGALPGIFAYFMHRRWRNSDPALPEDAFKINRINFWATIIILLSCIAIMSSVIMVAPKETFEAQKLITNKYIFLAISIFGTFTMLAALVIMRMVLKPKTLNGITPIIAFSAVLELAAVPLLVMGDMQSLTSGEGFLEIYAGHMLMAPFKIWVNMIVIAFAYRVVSPLIFNKTGNGWDAPKKVKTSKNDKAPKDELLVVAQTHVDVVNEIDPIKNNDIVKDIKKAKG